MPDNNVYGYTLLDDLGKIVYVGITNNPRARRAEHRLDGKEFAELKIETKPMSRQAALKWEARRIMGGAADKELPRLHRTEPQVQQDRRRRFHEPLRSDHLPVSDRLPGRRGAGLGRTRSRSL